MFSFSRQASIAAFSVTLILALTITGASVRAEQTDQLGKNLIVNGDAEADVGASDNTQVVKPTGWTTTGEFTAVQYGASGGFPDATSPGPKDRGKNDFEGGNVPKSTGTQTISLAPSVTLIGTGTVHFRFSAWLGGFEGQADNATATVAFEDANGATLLKTTLGPVTPQDRKGVTGLLPRETSGLVPKTATQAVVTIVFTRYEGTYNDGSADDISLVLSRPPMR
jgi:hypothetical protein